MRAAVLHGARDLRVEVVADPTPGARGVVIEVKDAGVCGSDVQEWARPEDIEVGQVMGHEFAGVVVERGEDADPRLRVGDRVVGLPLMPCGQCVACLADDPHLCRRRLQIGLSGLPGAFADYVGVPDAVQGRTVFPLPPEVKTTHGALAEPFAVGVHATSKLGSESLGAVAVFGAGPIGCAMAEVLYFRGVRRVIVVEPAVARQEVARRAGADVVLEPDAATLMSDLRDAAGVGELDAVIDCSGRPGMLAMGLEAVRWGGTVIAASQYPAGPALDPRVVMRHGIRVLGTFGARARDCAAALDLMATGRLDAGVLLDASFGLEQIGKAFEHASDPQATYEGVKVVVTPAAEVT